MTRRLSLIMTVPISATPELGLPTGQQQLLVFASDSFECIYHIAFDLCSRFEPGGAARLSDPIESLAIEFSIAQKQIFGLATKSINNELEEKLKRLVSHLEAMCDHDGLLRHNLSLEPGQYPLLSRLLRSFTSHSTGSVDSTARMIEKIICHNLFEFALSSRGQREEFWQEFASFSDLANRHTSKYKPSWPRLYPDRDTLDDLPRDIKSNLYQICREYSKCTCNQGNEVRLGLKGIYKGGDSNCLGGGTSVFDVLMRPMLPEEGHWRDTRLRVRLNIGSTGMPSQHIPFGAQALCDLVRSSSRLFLEVQDLQMHRLNEVGLPMQERDSGPSISLHAIIDSRCLSNVDKLVLSYVVARSFWQYYGSQWMDHESWTSHSIHFVMSKRVPNLEDFPYVVYANEPYFAAKFDKDGWNYDEYAGSKDVAHNYPRILAICTILLEIVSERRLCRSQYGSVERTMNTQFALAKRMAADNHKIWNNFEYKEFREALQTCLVSDTFDPDTTPAASESEHNIRRRRKMLHDNLVYPLHLLIRGLRLESELDRIRPLGCRISDSNKKEAGLSKKWMEDIQKEDENVRDLFRPPSSHAARIRPVRVAVLDTGYNPEALFFQPPEIRQKIRWKDFTGDDVGPMDVDGHGTHSTGLVMKLAPEAEIYVARITKDSESLDTADEAICNAITWATDEHDVDIISMSFGFDEDESKDVDAIRKTLYEQFDKRGLLLFASASNSGGNKPEMFPANCESVISIRQTDALGTFLKENPPMNETDACVYGTLGRNVFSSWKSPVKHEVPKSGSSVATAIAAGIAAMILTHASLGFPADGRPPWPIMKLWKPPGMMAMFSEMSVKNKSKDRHMKFLSPVDFYSKNGATAETVRAALRNACNSFR